MSVPSRVPPFSQCLFSHLFLICLFPPFRFFFLFLHFPLCLVFLVMVSVVSFLCQGDPSPISDSVSAFLDFPSSNHPFVRVFFPFVCLLFVFLISKSSFPSLFYSSSLWFSSLSVRACTYLPWIFVTFFTQAVVPVRSTFTFSSHTSSCVLLLSLTFCPPN